MTASCDDIDHKSLSLKLPLKKLHPVIINIHYINVLSNTLVIFDSPFMGKCYSIITKCIAMIDVYQYQTKSLLLQSYRAKYYILMVIYSLEHSILVTLKEMVN